MQPEPIDIGVNEFGEQALRQLVLEGYCILTSDREKKERLCCGGIPQDMVYYCPPSRRDSLIETLVHKGYRVVDWDKKELYTPTPRQEKKGGQVLYGQEALPRELEYWLEYWWAPQDIVDTIISIRRELDEPEFYMIVEGTRDKKALTAIFGREYENKIIVLNGGGKNLNPLEIERKLERILEEDGGIRIAIWTDLDSHGRKLERQLRDYLAGRAEIVLQHEKEKLLGYARRPCVEQLSSFVRSCKGRYTI